MSRHWSSHKYISAENFWSFIDELSSRLDIIGQHDSVESSELCKLFMLGRREMLDNITGFLHENETTLGEIVVGHGVMSPKELHEDQN